MEPQNRTTGLLKLRSNSRNVLLNLLILLCAFYAVDTFAAGELGISDSVKTLAGELWQAGKYFYYIIAMGVMGMGIWKWAHDHDASKGITLIVIGAVCCLIPWIIDKFSAASASSDPFSGGILLFWG